jgi:hypothetical protein
MRPMLALCVLGSMSSGSMRPGAGQDPHTSMDERGAADMGFDQDRTAHHFLLFKDGGAIDVGVKDRSDTNNRDAIRSHCRISR